MAGQPPPDEEPDPKPRVTYPDESRYKPSSADGRGRLRVQPERVETSSPVTLEYTFETAETGIAAGGGVSMAVSKFWHWTPPQTADPERPGYTTVACSREDVKLDIAVDANAGAVIARLGQALRGGDTLVFRYGDTSNGSRAQARGFSDRFAERGERFFFKVDGDGDGFFTALESQAAFRVEAAEAAALLAFGPSQAAVGEAISISVAAVDATFNRVESYTGKVQLEVVEGAATCTNGVELRPDDRGAVRVPVTPTETGVLRLRVAEADGATGTGGRTPSDTHLVEAVTNPILVSQSDKRPYTLYWGDLQIHSNVSDGTATPEEIYEYARDVARLDFAALTDHDYWGYRPLDTDAQTWEHILTVNKKYHDPSAFITFPGYEWTNWTFGHRHVLFADESEARIISCHNAGSDHPLELWSSLGDRNVMTIAHHTGGGPVPTFWKYFNSKYESVVEIASIHGVSEMMEHPHCIYSPVATGMVQSALARGYRLGLVGSGDTHDGHPGLGSPGHRAGLAAVYANGLTRQAVFEALRARRVYATTGCRAILRFHMGAAPMGSVVRLGTSALAQAEASGSEAAQTRELTVNVLGDAPIRSVTIVKNNAPVFTLPGEGYLVTAAWTDPQPARGGDYYYARVEQTDGEWIWSSPIWIELP